MSVRSSVFVTQFEGESHGNELGNRALFEGIEGRAGLSDVIAQPNERLRMNKEATGRPYAATCTRENGVRFYGGSLADMPEALQRVMPENVFIGTAEMNEAPSGCHRKARRPVSPQPAQSRQCRLPRVHIPQVPFPQWHCSAQKLWPRPRENGASPLIGSAARTGVGGH